MTEGKYPAELAKRNRKWRLNVMSESWSALGNLFLKPVYQQEGKQCDIAETREGEQVTMPEISPGFWAKLPTAERFTCFENCMSNCC